MHWKNSEQSWGWVTIIIHWLTAITVIGLIILGLWMVELTYYDSWYTKAPFIHKSVGVLILFLTLFRILWKSFNPKPKALPQHSRLEIRTAHIVHHSLYLLIFLVILSGYLISTADGRPLSVFGWFDIPALISGLDKQEDIAGAIHFYLAMGLIGLVVLHALGAIKHHVMDKDRTLMRMLWVKPDRDESL